MGRADWLTPMVTEFLDAAMPEAKWSGSETAYGQR
jgi:hypothetical protein